MEETLISWINEGEQANAVCVGGVSPPSPN